MAKGKAQAGSVNAKGEGVFERIISTKIHIEQGPDREELPFMPLRVKMVELPEFVKDKQNLYQVNKNMVRAIKVFYNGRQEEEIALAIVAQMTPSCITIELPQTKGCGKKSGFFKES